MKWQGERESDNVRDVRGEGGGGGGGGMRLGGGRGIGLGSIVIALVAGWLFGINPLTVLGLLGGDGGAPVAQTRSEGRAPAPQDTAARFVATVLASTEDVWQAQFRQAGLTYRAPKLNIFEGSYPTACGRGEAAMGPFYCPGDEQVYIDLAFFEQLRQLGAPGDFAQAYVVGHEVGHHVQHLLGITDKVDAQRGRTSPAEQNAASVRLELQADCFAGVWAHHSQQAKGWLERGDIEEGLNAAAKIGDDALQRRSGREARPESFTHGSSAQRVEWFKRGLDTGSVKQCDTFARSR